MAKGKFELAAEVAQKLPRRAALKRSGEDEAYLYAYYMQATAGDNTTPRPGASLKAKWCVLNTKPATEAGRRARDAWNSVKGTPKATACSMYVEKVVAILTAAGDNESKRRIEAAK